ncbi:hypothetical protein C1H23_01870 [Brucella melitensis]|nr:hypothetical protein CT124_01880 [Brucella melitensis]AUS56617.1 hypothetical protein C1A46_01885 [Brucella abortus]AVO72079.1 hypothetical protein C6Y57_09385 [Brucella canis]PXG10520.1 hypothetical protein DMP29_07880 [Brucella suis]AUS46828.1 hypothetical protein C0R52_05455 [Brucella melitensis]
MHYPTQNRFALLLEMLVFPVPRRSQPRNLFKFCTAGSYRDAGFRRANPQNPRNQIRGQASPCHPVHARQWLAFSRH